MIKDKLILTLKKVIYSGECEVAGADGKIYQIRMKEFESNKPLTRDEILKKINNGGSGATKVTGAFVAIEAVYVDDSVISDSNNDIVFKKKCGTYLYLEDECKDALLGEHKF